MKEGVNQFFSSLPETGIGFCGANMTRAQEALKAGLTPRPESGATYFYYYPRFPRDLRFAETIRIIDSMRWAVFNTWGYACSRAKNEEPQGKPVIIVFMPPRIPRDTETSADKYTIIGRETMRINKDRILGIVELPFMPERRNFFRTWTDDHLQFTLITRDSFRGGSDFQGIAKFGNKREGLSRRDINNILLQIKEMVENAPKQSLFDTTSFRLRSLFSF